MFPVSIIIIHVLLAIRNRHSCTVRVRRCNMLNTLFCIHRKEKDT